MLTATPPRTEVVRLEKGVVGWGVFGLQRALNMASTEKLVADGDFGDATLAAVKRWQTERFLTVDGIAGAATQKTLVLELCARVDGAIPTVPVGALKGLTRLEGAWRLGPVNWSVAGGVDCGAIQERVFEPFALAATEHAFAPYGSIKTAAEKLVRRRDAFLSSAWASVSLERAGRCALFAHNWPTAGGADYYAVHGHVENPSGRCTWVPRDAAGLSLVRFPDTTRVETRQDWAEFYAMGGIHGEGAASQYVTHWA